MSAWILLKIIPSLSNYFEVPDIRQLVYPALAFLVLLAIIVKYALHKALKPDQISSVLILLFFLVFTINAINQDMSGEKAETFLLARSLFLMVTLSIFLKYNSGKSMLLYSLLIYFLVVQIVSAFDYFSIISSNNTLSDERNAGILSSTFTMSYSSVTYAGISLIYLEHCKSNAIKTGLYLIIIVCAINLFYSVSRTSIMGIGLIGMSWLLEKITRNKITDLKNKIRKARPLLLVLIICSICIYVFSKDFTDYIGHGIDLWKIRTSAILSDGIQGQESRWLTNIAGMNIFLQHPLSGVGWDNVARIATKYGAGMDSTAHNVFIQSAAEGGLIGITFSVLLFLIFPYKLFIRNRNVPGCYLFMGTWLAVLFFNLTASNLHLEAHWDLFFFWMILTSLFSQESLTGSKYVRISER